MLPFLNAINDICVRYLRYPEKLFPVRVDSEKIWSFQKLSEKVFADLTACHEPVLHPSQTDIFHDIWVKGMRFFRNRWKYEMVYKESAWKALARLGVRKGLDALDCYRKQ